MNKSEIPTYQKIMLPLRLEPEIYDLMVARVQKRKKKTRGYSINQYLTELIEEDLKRRLD